MRIFGRGLGFGAYEDPKPQKGPGYASSPSIRAALLPSHTHRTLKLRALRFRVSGLGFRVEGGAHH